MTTPSPPWVIVLAGGDGRRLDGARILGRILDRPKQFCRFHDSESLLQRTLRRASVITESGRIMPIVREDHRSWWKEELHDLPAENILTEPANRGTGVAMLHALVHVLQRDEDPTLVFLPSDHAADDETVLVESIELAARLSARGREHLLLLGVTPENAETEYGWLVPSRRGGGRVRSVDRFVEKPHARLAAELLAGGALWNSFICIASGHALLEVFEGIQPRMLNRYLQYFLALQEHDSREHAMFQALPSVDFCREILESAAGRLRVLTVPPCGWTDLGTPLRIGRWLHRRRSATPTPVARPSLIVSPTDREHAIALPTGAWLSRQP